MNMLGGIELETVKGWIVNIMAIGEQRKDNLLADIFSVYLESMLCNEWRGACHDLSTAFYMTTSEYNFKPILCTGVVRTKDKLLFDHSWVEIDGCIYDFAISYPSLDGTYVSPPVFASLNVETRNSTDLDFGVYSHEFGDIAKTILNFTIDEYAGFRPKNHKDMYEMAAEFGSSIPPDRYRKILISDVLKEKYATHKRTHKNSIN